MLKKKQNMKNQTKAGTNFSLKYEVDNPPQKNNSQTFFDKNTPPVLSAVTFGYQTVSHICQGPPDSPCFSSLLSPHSWVEMHTSPGGAEEPSPRWHPLAVGD